MKKNNKFSIEFIIVTFGWSWFIWIPFVLGGMGILPIEPRYAGFFTMLATFGPGVGAFFCLRKYQGKGAISKYLIGLLDFKLGLKAWIFPLLIGCGSVFTAWILPEFWGEPRPPFSLNNVIAFPVIVVFMALIGGGNEELGWRGYILDDLEERFGPWKGNFILAAIWWAWHLPLFFIPGTNQSYFGQPAGIALTAFALLVFGMTGILAWARQASGKRLTAGIYVHALLNTSPMLFPVLILKTGVPQPRVWIWTGLIAVTGLCMLAIRAAKRVKQAD